MKTLNGTTKQVDWANEIRTKTINSIEFYKSELFNEKQKETINKTNQLKGKEYRKERSRRYSLVFSKVIEIIENIEEATWFIDNRDINFFMNAFNIDENLNVSLKK